MNVHVLLFMLRACAQGADSRQWVLSGRDVSRRPQHEHQTKVVVAIGVGVSVDTGAYYCYSSLRWRSHSGPALWRRRESAWVLAPRRWEWCYFCIARTQARLRLLAFHWIPLFSPFYISIASSYPLGPLELRVCFSTVQFPCNSSLTKHSDWNWSLNVIFVFVLSLFCDHHNFVYLKPSHVHFPLFIAFPLRFLPSSLTPGPRRSPLCISHFGDVKDIWPVRCSDAGWTAIGHLPLFCSYPQIVFCFLQRPFPCQPGISIQCSVLCLSIPVVLLFCTILWLVL